MINVLRMMKWGYMMSGSSMVHSFMMDWLWLMNCDLVSGVSSWMHDSGVMNWSVMSGCVVSSNRMWCSHVMFVLIMAMMVIVMFIGS